MSLLSQRLFQQTLVGRLLLMLLVVGGIYSYTGMLRENNPDLQIPQALVTVEWPGAAPEQIEKEVTKPLEDKVRTLKGLKRFDSGSYNSFAVLAVEFDADVAVSEAMQRLRARLDEAEAEFPSAAGIEKPEVEEMSAIDMPVVSWMLHGDVDDLILTDAAKRLQRSFESISGVKKVDLGGLREKSLHIQLKPHKLRELGISPVQVVNRVQDANRDMAWGEFQGSENLFNMYLEGRFDSVARVRQLPIARLGNNRVVRLQEIADVDLRLDRLKSRAYFSLAQSDFTPGVTLDVLRRPGEDTFALIEQTRQIVEASTAADDWPRGLQITRISDDAEIIELAFGDVSSSMYQGVIVVFLVLVLLLTWREAIVAGLAILVTMLGTLAVVNLMGYTFNTMVMIGMVLALGLLVDVFILVMEGMHDGIYIHRLDFSQSARQTVRNYMLPAIAGQATTILALLPIMFVGGIDGKFIRILPVTMTVALLVSLVVAFLICIPLSRYLLQSEEGKSGELPIDRISARYRDRLKSWLLTHVVKSKVRAAAWVSTAVTVFVLSLLAAGMLPVLMYESSDDRKIGIAVELGPNATLGESQRVAELIMDYLQAQPWIEKSIAYVGQKSPVTTSALADALLPNEAYNQVGFTVLLPPKDERERLSFEYMGDMRAGIEEVLSRQAGLSYSLVNLGGNPNPSDPVQIEITGSDYGTLREIAAQVRLELSRVQGAVGVRDNMGPPLQEMRFQFVPEQLNFYGLQEADVLQQIRLHMAEDKYGKFKVAGVEDDPDIRISTQWPSRDDDMGLSRHMAELMLMHVIDGQGRPVSLANLVTEREVESPRVFVHANGRRSVTVSARVDDRTAAEVVEDMLPFLEQAQADWPTGYRYRLGGELETTAESYTDMGAAFVVALLLIFMLLALLFNSMRQPLIILLSVPLAMTGTFLGFFLSGIPLSFTSLVGLVSLAGITVNDAIVMVETMNKHRHHGMSLSQAAARGAGDRLRPIISTSLTTVLALIPLAYSDPGWYALCMAIIFGLVASTLSAMVIIPGAYLLLSPGTIKQPRTLALEQGTSDAPAH